MVVVEVEDGVGEEEKVVRERLRFMPMTNETRYKVFTGNKRYWLRYIRNYRMYRYGDDIGWCYQMNNVGTSRAGKALMLLTY